MVVMVLSTAALRAELAGNPELLDLNHDRHFGDQWGNFGAASFLDYFPNGNPGHAVFYADQVENSGGFFQQGTRAVAGAKYTFSIDAAFEANWSAHVRFGLEFYPDDDETSLGETLVEIEEPLPDTSYHTYTMSAIAPSGSVYVRPIVRYDDVVNVQGSNESATFDNAHLEEIPPPGSAESKAP
jgi:hypothetical protein